MRKWIMGIVVLLFVGVAGFIFVRQASPVVCTMSGERKVADSGSSETTFRGKKGEIFTIECTSEVKQGVISFSLRDSKGNEIQTYEGGLFVKEEIILEKDDLYSLWANYDNFAGHFFTKIENKNNP